MLSPSWIEIKQKKALPVKELSNFLRKIKEKKNGKVADDKKWVKQ